MVLERTVIGADPRLGIAAVEQTPGIGLGQGPAHQLQTFVQHRAIAEHQHRNRSLGRGLQHHRWLGLEFNLSPLHDQPCLEQGPAGSHGVRAAAEAVEDRQHVLGGAMRMRYGWA